MSEGTDSVLHIESVPLNISYKSFKTSPVQNSYCDHRNFDSVNQSSAAGFRHCTGMPARYQILVRWKEKCLAKYLF